MPKFQVKRSTVIDAPIEKVYDTFADFSTWTTWSPWLIAEPDAKVVVSASPSTVGATYEWIGDITGQGRLEHKRLEPHRLIEDDLNFIKPFKSYALDVLRFEPAPGGTRVIWAMDSSLPWFLFWMIPMMKTFIGMDYARGLAMAKEWIETGSISSKSTILGVQKVGPLRMVGIASSSSVDDIGPSMERAFDTAKAEMTKHGLPLNGDMISVYKKFHIKSGFFDYISGYVIPAEIELPGGTGLQSWSLGSCKAFHVQHIGSYKHLGNAWSIANMHIRHKKIKQSRVGTYEIYRTVPPVPDNELITDIYLPLK